MSAASRPISTGKTRTCPHCKATILESLSICPGCMHHLRFDSEAAKRQVAAAPALRVEGIIRHPPLEQPLEYFVIIAIRNDRGEEVTRQVVNVGALQAAEKRTFTLSVEVLPPTAPATAKSGSATGTFKSPATPPAMAAPQATPAAGAANTASAPPASSSPAPSSSQTATQASPGSASAASARTSSSAANPQKSASNLNPLAPTPNPPGAPAAGGAKTAAPPANPSAPAGSAANPATAPKSTSGYTLKPPSPGGPKRH